MNDPREPGVPLSRRRVKLLLLLMFKPPLGVAAATDAGVTAPPQKWLPCTPVVMLDKGPFCGGGGGGNVEGNGDGDGDSTKGRRTINGEMGVQRKRGRRGGFVRV